MSNPTDEQPFSDVSGRVRSLLDRHGISRKQQAAEISRILELSLSQAHRKLKGENDWTISQIREIASAFNESATRLIGSLMPNDSSPEGIANDAIFVVNGYEMHCLAYIGPPLEQGRFFDFVAQKQGSEWRIYPSHAASQGERHGVELIEIRARQASAEGPIVAVLDDAHAAADEICTYLTERGYRTVAYYNAPSFRAALHTQPFDAFVLDWLVGSETAEGSIRDIRESDNPDAPIVILTGLLDSTDRESEIALAMRNFDLLGPFEKPVKLHVIEAVFARHFRR